MAETPGLRDGSWPTRSALLVTCSEGAVDALLEDSRRIAREYGTAEKDLPLRVFVYAFGLREGDGCADALTLLRLVASVRQRAEKRAQRIGDAIAQAVNGPVFQASAKESAERAEQRARNTGEQLEKIITSVEFEELVAYAKARAEADARAKGERMRRSASSLGGLASAARSFGFGGLVDSYAASAAAEAKRKLKAEAEVEVLAKVVRYLRERLQEPPPDVALRRAAEAWKDGGQNAASRSLEQSLRQDAEECAGREVAGLLKSHLDDDLLTESDLSQIVRDWHNGGEDAAKSAVEKALRSRAEESARTELNAALKRDDEDTTLTASELAELWASYSMSSGEGKSFIFGTTPMRACLQKIAERLKREEGRPAAEDEERVLLIISDGAPTDGSHDQLAALAEAVKERGCNIACAYITDDDVHAPHELRACEESQWPSGAKLLFGMASSLDEIDDAQPAAQGKRQGFHLPFLGRREPAKAEPNVKTGAALRRALEQAGWTVPSGAKLFLQANHSEVLADFMRVALTAVSAQELIERGLRIYGE